MSVQNFFFLLLRSTIEVQFAFNKMQTLQEFCSLAFDTDGYLCNHPPIQVQTDHCYHPESSFPGVLFTFTQVTNDLLSITWLVSSFSSFQIMVKYTKHKIQHIHIAMQPPPPSVSTSSPPPSPALGTHPSTFCLCDSDYSRDLKEVKSDSICLFVTGLFHQHNVLKVHPCCSASQCFIPFLS